MRMEMVAAFTNLEKARDLAIASRGTLLCDERENTSHLPFSALVVTATDNLPDLLQTADVGVYLVCRRVIKPREKTTESNDRRPGVIGLFTLVANPRLGHQQADEHWRDKHAPLALDVHKAMSHYAQLSIVHRFHGPEWDGFALCGFDSLEDLRLRFFDSAAGEKAIAVDVAIFSDHKLSPRRIIASEFSYAKNR